MKTTTTPTANRPPTVSTSGEVRLIKLTDVLRIYPVGKTKWYAGVKSGLHPRPRKLPGSRSSVWIYDEVMALNEKVRDSA